MEVKLGKMNFLLLNNLILLIQACLILHRGSNKLVDPGAELHHRGIGGKVVLVNPIEFPFYVPVVGVSCGFSF